MTWKRKRCEMLLSKTAPLAKAYVKEEDVGVEDVDVSGFELSSTFQES